MHAEYSTKAALHLRHAPGFPALFVSRSSFPRFLSHESVCVAEYEVRGMAQQQTVRYVLVQESVVTLQAARHRPGQRHRQLGDGCVSSPPCSFFGAQFKHVSRRNELESHGCVTFWFYSLFRCSSCCLLDCAQGIRALGAKHLSTMQIKQKTCTLCRKSVTGCSRMPVVT